VRAKNSVTALYSDLGWVRIKPVKVFLFVKLFRQPHVTETGRP